MKQYDVVVVGAGVTGCAIARELSRYDWKVCVVERDEDVCTGTSKANSGIVHSGVDAHYGTKKAQMNIEGSRMMEKLSKDLDFAYQKNGSLIICTDETQRGELEQLLENGRKNGVEGLCLISGKEAREMEPELSDQVVAALYAPTGGIVCPFGLTIALAENAADNGVEFRFLSEVTGVRKSDEGFIVELSGQSIQTRYLVNAAGVYADTIHNMLSSQKRTIIPRRGEYCLFDKSEGSRVSRTIFQLPTRFGKGVLVTPTVHGNLMIGPNAVDIGEEKEGVATTAEGLADIMEKAALSLGTGAGKGLSGRKIITSFAGLLAHTEENDFTLEEAADVPGLFDALGIESPGLTAAPAIGVFMAGLVWERANRELAGGVRKKEQFQETRKGILNPSELSEEERNALIAKTPEYGTILCRCERISEGEILDAIHRTLGAKSLDGIKRRTRAGMGRCQSGFCSPKIVELLARELGVSMEEITKAGPGSELLTGAIQKGC